MPGFAPEPPGSLCGGRGTSGSWTATAVLRKMADRRRQRASQDTEDEESGASGSDSGGSPARGDGSCSGSAGGGGSGSLPSQRGGRAGALHLRRVESGGAKSAEESECVSPRAGWAGGRWSLLLGHPAPPVGAGSGALSAERASWAAPGAEEASGVCVERPDAPRVLSERGPVLPSLVNRWVLSVKASPRSRGAANSWPCLLSPQESEDGIEGDGE